MSTASTPRKSRSACPLCGSAASPKHSPFCSQGCRDRDLLKWLGEGYRVAGPPTEEIAGDGLDSER